MYLVTACKGRKVPTVSFLAVHKIGATPEPLRILIHAEDSVQFSVQSAVGSELSLCYASVRYKKCCRPCGICTAPSRFFPGVFLSLYFFFCLLFTLFSRNRPKLLLFLICAKLPVSYDSSQCLRQRMVVGGRIQIRTQLSVCASYASFSASYGSCFLGIGK